MNIRVSLIPPTSLILATQRMLRPLVRLLMSHGVAYPYFTTLAKAVFVEVGAQDFPEKDGSTTDSRVSLLSGVHRREVKRLRNESADFGPPATVSMGAQVVALWCADARYLDAEGRPMPLPRLARKGGDASFENLVASISKDIRSRAVLDEWINLGVAWLDDEDRVCLVDSAFIPALGFDEKAFFLGKGISDHLAAASHNMLGQQPPFFDRMAYYDGLSRESISTLSEFAKVQSMQALHEFNRKALALQAEDKNRLDANMRVTFGAYLYSETPKQDVRDAE